MGPEDLDELTTWRNFPMTQSTIDSKYSRREIRAGSLRSVKMSLMMTWLVSGESKMAAGRMSRGDKTPPHVSREISLESLKDMA